MIDAVILTCSLCGHHRDAHEIAKASLWPPQPICACGCMIYVCLRTGAHDAAQEHERQKRMTKVPK